MKTVLTVIKWILIILAIFSGLIILWILYTNFIEDKTDTIELDEADKLVFDLGITDERKRNELQKSAETISYAFRTFPMRWWERIQHENWPEDEELALSEIRKWNKSFGPALQVYYAYHTGDSEIGIKSRRLNIDCKDYLSADEYDSIKDYF